MGNDHEKSFVHVLEKGSQGQKHVFLTTAFVKIRVRSFFTMGHGLPSVSSVCVLYVFFILSSTEDINKFNNLL